MSGERVQNLLALQLEQLDNPPGHRFEARSLGEIFGASATGLSVYELEPGNASWPYHLEVVDEEWLIVIDGEVTLRTPEGETILRAGDVACFPAGAGGAHAVRNHTHAPARYAMPSTNAFYGNATIYPDSRKLQVWTRGFDHRGRLGDPLGYWEGEE